MLMRSINEFLGPAKSACGGRHLVQEVFAVAFYAGANLVAPFG
jgi:hypothetical protein